LVGGGDFVFVGSGVIVGGGSVGLRVGVGEGRVGDGLIGDAVSVGDGEGDEISGVLVGPGPPL
jgi:hypothetical protein